MNINLVRVNDLHVSFDIEQVNGSIMIVASIIKEGETIHKTHKAEYKGYRNCEFISKLLDRDFAKEASEHIIASAIKGGLEL